MQIKFTKYNGPDGMYYIKMHDENGSTLLQCTGCSTELDNITCQADIRRAAANDASYERSSTSDDIWYFSLRSPDGRTIAISRHFQSQQDMERSIAEIKSSM